MADARRVSPHVPAAAVVPAHVAAAEVRTMTPDQEAHGHARMLRDAGLSDGEIITALANHHAIQRGIANTMRDLLSEVIAEREALKVRVRELEDR